MKILLALRRKLQNQPSKQLNKCQPDLNNPRQIRQKKKFKEDLTYKEVKEDKQNQLKSPLKCSLTPAHKLPIKKQQYKAENDKDFETEAYSPTQKNLSSENTKITIIPSLSKTSKNIEKINQNFGHIWKKIKKQNKKFLENFSLFSINFQLILTLIFANYLVIECWDCPQSEDSDKYYYCYLAFLFLAGFIFTLIIYLAIKSKIHMYFGFFAMINILIILQIKYILTEQSGAQILLTLSLQIIGSVLALLIIMDITSRGIELLFNDKQDQLYEQVL